MLRDDFFMLRLPVVNDLDCDLIVKYLFFLNVRAGGILRILQFDWLWKRAEFFLSCLSRPGCVSLCNDLKVPVFDTESVYIQKCFNNKFLLDKRRGNRIQIKNISL